MNKSDVKLIIYLTMIILFILGIMKISSKKGNTAIVYYMDEEVLRINLSKDANYTTKGYNGEVNLIVSNGKIRVDSENSPLHLCSKQGFISKSSEVIVCLPNKLIIKIIDDEKLDGVVG